MISFKLTLSLFVAALVTQCFALPVDQTTESFTSSSPLTESLSVRHVDESIATSSPSEIEGKHLDTPTKEGTKRAELSDSFADQSTTFETGTKETREFPESFTSEPESSSFTTLHVVTRNHVEGHLETETPLSITTVTVPFEKRAFPKDSTLTPETESTSTSSSSLKPVQSDKGTRHLEDDSHNLPKSSTDDKTHVESEEYKQPFESTDVDREDRFQDKSNLPKAEYDPSSATVEVKLPSNQMYHDENKISVTGETSTTMKSTEHVEKREKTPEKVKTSSELELTTVRPVGAVEKREETSKNVKASLETEFTTVRPVKGAEKREVSDLSTPSSESELTTVHPTETVEKREETSEKVKTSLETEFTTVRPTERPSEGAEKREVSDLSTPSSESELTTVHPTETVEKREKTTEEVKTSSESEFTTVRPVEGAEKREVLDVNKSSSESEFTTVRPVEAGEKRAMMVTDKLSVKDDKTSSAMKADDKLIKRHEVPVKEALLIGEKQESTATLDQGSTLVLFLLAGFLFCACLLASTLAFVKTHQSLKRKSRIIEMEAHLDEHYHQFNPLFFQHHGDKN